MFYYGALPNTLWCCFDAGHIDERPQHEAERQQRSLHWNEAPSRRSDLLRVNSQIAGCVADCIAFLKSTCNKSIIAATALSRCTSNLHVAIHKSIALYRQFDAFSSII